MRKSEIVKVSVIPFFRYDGKIYYGYIEHPKVGNQILSGTIEPGENPVQAAVRELEEEFGIIDVKNISSIFKRSIGKSILNRDISFDNFSLRRGLYVDVIYKLDGQVFVRYTEYNKEKKNNLDYSIDFWCMEDSLWLYPEREFYKVEVVAPEQTVYQRIVDGNKIKVRFSTLNEELSKGIFSILI